MSLSSNSMAFVLNRISTSDKNIEIEKVTKLNAKIILAIAWNSIKIKNIHKIKSKTLIVWGEDDRIIPFKKNFHNFKLI